MGWGRLAAWTFAACAAAASSAGGEETSAASRFDPEAVSEAVTEARAYLWRHWDEDRACWPEPADAENTTYRYNEGGLTALCLYAALAAGEDRQDDRVKRTLEWLAERKMTGTYAVALRASVWAELGSKHKYHDQMVEDVATLVRGVGGHGGYGYILRDRGGAGRGRNLADNPKIRYDNSNTQLAVLGVWAGQRQGVEVPAAFWRLQEKHWRRTQHRDGGWGYRDHYGSSYGSMTVAGLASLFICFDSLYAREYVGCDGNPEYQPLRDGLAWLDEHFTAQENPGKRQSHLYYYLYGVERVGLAGGLKYFGGKDWYKEGARELLSRRRDGGWGNLENTAFALLFLARGQHPIAFNKLWYNGTWNNRPRDMSNVTRWISREFESPVYWQIIRPEHPVREWHDAPILYISGATTPRFKDRELRRLRRFVLQGGMLLSESACSRASFTLAMRKVYAKLFPGRPLQRLPDDHPVYGEVHYRLRERPELWGISNGIRLLAVHSPEDLSLRWQTNSVRARTEAFQLAANLYFLATDKGSLRRRGTRHWPEPSRFDPAATLRVAPVRHEGNHRPEPLAWEAFALRMGQEHRVKVELAEPTDPAGLDAEAWPVAVMTGTGTFSFTPEQRKALRAYLQAGGTLIADAGGGDEVFAEAFSREMDRVLPQAKDGLLYKTHPVFTRAGPRIEEVAYRRALQASHGRSRSPRLTAWLQGNRAMVIFSPADLTSGLIGYQYWGLKGYQPQSSFEILRNAILYAGGVKLPRQVEPGGREPPPGDVPAGPPPDLRPVQPADRDEPADTPRGTE
jgi:hypothetical protein